MSIEIVILSGNVGTNDGLKDVGESQVCNLSLAVDNPRDKDKPIWHRLVCWNETAKIAAEYATKGREISVTGRVQERTYKKSDGTEGHATEIVVDKLYLDTFQLTVVKGNIGENRGLTTVGANATKKCEVSLAASSGKKDAPPNWFNVVFWGRTAEIAAEYATKGRQITVAGRISNQSYDKEDGTKGFRSELIGDQLILGRKPKEDAGAAAPAQQSAQQPAAQAAPAAAPAAASPDDLDSILDF